MLVHHRFSPFYGLIFALLLTLLNGCAASPRYGHHIGGNGDNQRSSRKQDFGPVDPSGHQMEGMGSFYARSFNGKKTASGAIFNINDFTAAHRTLPFGTRVTVTNLDNGKKTTVQINDRGPHRKNRVIDLSPVAAEEVDMIRAGTARVRLDIIQQAATNADTSSDSLSFDP